MCCVRKGSSNVESFRKHNTKISQKKAKPGVYGVSANICYARRQDGLFFTCGGVLRAQRVAVDDPFVDGQQCVGIIPACKHAALLTLDREQ